MTGHIDKTFNLQNVHKKSVSQKEKKLNENEKKE